MTKEQAVNLWNILMDEYFEMSPFQGALKMVGSNLRSIKFTEGVVETYHNNLDCMEVSNFLKQWADALKQDNVQI